MEVEEIMQVYDRFVEIIEEFSMPPQEQIEKLRGTVVADELASDFSDIAFSYAQILKDNQWIDEKQFRIVEDINSQLDRMSQSISLWDEKAIIYSNDWKQCREKGKQLLSSLIAEK